MQSISLIHYTLAYERKNIKSVPVVIGQTFTCEYNKSSSNRSEASRVRIARNQLIPKWKRIRIDFCLSFLIVFLTFIILEFLVNTPLDDHLIMPNNLNDELMGFMF